ncbi:MAG: type II secretion system F family protein [Myxococcales bacterium]|nr:type II secretion system F family protein [Myxococcales bacterium]MBL0192923.1 type II secretion system F family protein [Myxococcales bacterium]
MAEFVWEARGRAGDLRRGTMEAEDESVVNTRLRAQQLMPTKVKKKSASINFSFGSGVSAKDLLTFTRLFATMIDAGLPIVQCLEILQGQTENKRFAVVLADIKASVEQGMTFSDSLRRHPKVFDQLYVNLVQAGEVGGILDTILNRLAQYNEKAVKLARQVKGALVYPSVVFVIFVVLIVGLLGFVVPQFKGIFKDLGSDDELPWLTQKVVAVSEGFTSHFFLIALSVGGVVFAWSVAYSRTPFKRAAHRVFLRLPVIGDVLQKIAVARFTRTLGTLLTSGVPILDALDIVAKTAGNLIIMDAIYFCKQKVSEGQNISVPLLEAKVFPPMVVQMVGVGEQTGALDQMLTKIADFYEDEVDVAVAALTSLIEPVMMVGIGGTVGIVLISMYLPIFSIAGKIKTT